MQQEEEWVFDVKATSVVFFTFALRLPPLDHYRSSYSSEHNLSYSMEVNDRFLSWNEVMTLFIEFW